MVKNPPTNARDASLIPGSGKSPGEGNGSPLQYLCLEISMDRGAWQATVMGPQSQTWLSTHPHIHTRTPNGENKIQGQISNFEVHFLPFSSHPRIPEYFLRLKGRLTHWDFKTKLDTRKKRQWLWQKICLLLYIYALCLFEYSLDCTIIFKFKALIQAL